MRVSAAFAAATFLVVLAHAGRSQILDHPDTVFPAETRDPKQAGGADLLEAVCPGSVAAAEKIGCATGCPDYTGFGEIGDRLPWSIGSVITGHFLAPTSEDAALWMVGCEAHQTNNSGTILLTRISGKWSMVWYKPAIQTNSCHKVALRDRREILVCMGYDGGQGIVFSELYVEDLLDPKPTLMAAGSDDGGFFGTSDNTNTCGWRNEADKPDSATVIHTHIDRVEFHTGRGPAGSPSISVTASFGTRRVKRSEIDACERAHKPLAVATRSYRMMFLFDGHRFQSIASSAAAVRIFGSR